MAKSKARKWPEEKELLDKCDGLATAAGKTDAQMHTEISMSMHRDQQALLRTRLVRQAIVLRGTEKFGQSELRKTR